MIDKMINIETVLILGAGASKPFGFPTGRELVGKTCNQSGELNINAALFNEIAIEQGQGVINEFTLALRDADPPSVDIWLEHNPKFIKVGKTALAMVLLAHEFRSNLKPEKNWYQLLFDRLNAPFNEFQNNKLAIVTFNYDRSLEQYFFQRLKRTYTGKNESEYIEKLNQLKILHIYGSLGRLPWQIDDPKNSLPEVPYGRGEGREKQAIISAANSIEIMSDNSSSVSDRLQKFQKLMKGCKALYFLGFGYHETNMKRLEIDTLRMPSKIMGTAYGLSYQRMKEIARLDIKQLRFPEGLFSKPIYDFLHKCVDFNEGSYPENWVYEE